MGSCVTVLFVETAWHGMAWFDLFPSFSSSVTCVISFSVSGTGAGIIGKGDAAVAGVMSSACEEDVSSAV